MSRQCLGTGLLGLAVLLLSSGVCAAQDDPSALVKTATLARQQLSETLVAYGPVRADPDNESSITVPREASLIRMHVRLGEKVQAGAPLFELETAPTAHMAYQQAEAAVDYAKSQLSQIKRLYANQLATNDQVASAERALEDAQAQLRAQKSLGTEQGSETIRAPFDGIVTKVLVTQGDRVQANTTAMILARTNALLVPLGIEPEDAPRIEPGMTVSLKSLFPPYLEAQGRIHRVHAMVDPATRLVDVIVKIDGAEASGLVLGMNMEGKIILTQAETLAVSRSAVLRDSSGAYLFVVHDGHARKVAVKTGLEENGLIGVSGPLQEGDRIVIEGNYELTDGMAVREAGR